MPERRDPVPESAKYYRLQASAHADKGEYMDAHFAMREAFNHLENAAYAEAEAADKLKAGYRLIISQVHHRPSALIREGEYAEFWASRQMTLPFVPFVGLTVEFQATPDYFAAVGEHYKLRLEEVVWDGIRNLFVCEAQAVVCEYQTWEEMKADADDMKAAGFDINEQYMNPSRWKKNETSTKTEAP